MVKDYLELKSQSITPVLFEIIFPTEFEEIVYNIKQYIKCGKRAHCDEYPHINIIHFIPAKETNEIKI